MARGGWIRGGWAVGMGAAVLAGAVTGLGTHTFIYADGASYLTDDPAACANCHVMRSHLDAWVKSTHHAVATCNDCHAPHDSLFDKLRVKAINGFNHSWAFTSGDYLEPIRITPANRAVTQAACRHCHERVVAQIDGAGRGRDALDCIRCHPGVGHP